MYLGTYGLSGRSLSTYIARKDDTGLELNLEFTREEFFKIPNESGIYVLMSDKRDILYVGQSKKLLQRVKCHLRSFNHKVLGETSTVIYIIGVIRCSIESLNAEEMKLIEELKPLFNKESNYDAEYIKSFQFNNYDAEIIMPTCEFIHIRKGRCKKTVANSEYCALHTKFYERLGI